MKKFNIFKSLEEGQFEITVEKAQDYFKFINANLNLAKVQNKGWIVDFVYTDHMGNYEDGSGECVTGYLIDENGNTKNRQLITVKIKHKTIMEGYDIIITNGMDERPFFVLTRDIGKNKTGKLI